jgi:hypothetical protein
MATLMERDLVDEYRIWLKWLRAQRRATYEWAPVPKSDRIETHPTPSVERVASAKAP